MSLISDNMVKHNKNNKQRKKSLMQRAKGLTIVGIVVLALLVGFAIGLAPFSQLAGASVISGVSISELQDKLNQNEQLSSQLKDYESQNSELKAKIAQLEQENTSLKLQLLNLLNLLLGGQQNSGNSGGSGGSGGGSSGGNGGSSGGNNPFGIVPTNPIQVTPNPTEPPSNLEPINWIIPVEPIQVEPPTGPLEPIEIPLGP